LTDITDKDTGKCRVLSEKCATCVLHPPGRRIALTSERVTQFVRDAVDRDTFVVCHSTLPGMSGEDPAVCAGFFDSYDTTPLQLMRRLDHITFVTLPEQHADGPAQR
jgi:hypothetical protein